MSANDNHQPESSATAVLCRLALFTGCGALTGFGAGVLFGPIEDLLTFWGLNIPLGEIYADWVQNYHRLLWDYAKEGLVLGLLFGALTSALSGFWSKFRHPLAAGILWASMFGTLSVVLITLRADSMFRTQHALRCAAAGMALATFCGFVSALAVRMNDRRRIRQQ